MAKQDNFATKAMWQLKASVLVICLFWVGNNAFAVSGQVSTQMNGRIEQLIQTTERQYGIPSGLLAAIAQVESGMNAHAINYYRLKPVVWSTLAKRIKSVNAKIQIS